jgi:hypothetical protein
VYELYWGDLSQTKNLVATIIQTLFLPYRFIFLGELAWRSFAPDRPGKSWAAAGVLYRIARYLMTVVVPLLLTEMLLLGVIGATLPIKIDKVPWVVATILGLGGAVLTGTRFYKSRSRMSALPFALTVLVSGLVFGTAGFLLIRRSAIKPYDARDVLAAEILIVGWAFTAWLLSLMIEQRTALIQWTWAIISALTFADFAITGFKSNLSDYLRESLTSFIMWPTLGAIVFLISTLLCFVCVVHTYARIPPELRSQLNGTLWTMAFGLSVTSAAIALPIAALPALMDLPFFSRISSYTTNPFSGFADAFIVPAIARALSGIPIGGVAAIGLLVLTAILALAPSLYAEFRPLPAQDYNAMRSGWWLSNGLGCFTFAGVVASVCIIVFPMIWTMVVFKFGSGEQSKLGQLADWFGDSFWKLVGLSLTTVAFKLSGAATRVVTSVVGIVLDIELYLRDRPLERTTRALIHQRFLTLLDHVNRQQYDEIVFIAHSQGTVILMDGLRYLHLSAQRPAQPSTKSVITLGSPLRQLYAAAFPPLFNWASTPDPKSAGIDAWSNLYRSGDYVGRQLSQGDTAEGIYDSAVITQGSSFRESCIGAGAHTHYWNSPEVARELDRVLREGRVCATQSSASD